MPFAASASHAMSLYAIAHYAIPHYAIAYNDIARKPARKSKLEERNGRVRGAVSRASNARGGHWRIRRASPCHSWRPYCALCHYML
jgi:hypothetical protein